MKPATVQILRAVGLLIETAGLMAFVSLRNDPWAVAGIELRHAAFALMALGFGLWVVSIAARPSWTRRRREPD